MSSMLRRFNLSTQGQTTFFMWLLGAYYVMILNQHFNIPLRFIPWALIGFAGYILWKKFREQSWNFLQITELFSSSDIKILLAAIGIVSLCFFIATFAQHPDVSGIYDLVTIYVGPIALGIIAFIVLPKNNHSIQFLNLACTAAVIFLGFTDIFHYCREFYKLGKFADPYAHRWFSDGYLFFIPWLFLGFFSSQNRWIKIVWALGIWSIVILLTATGGSRGAIAVLVSQLSIFIFMSARKGSLAITITSLVALLGFGFLGALYIAPQAIEASIKKGLFIGDRIYDAWLPVIDFIHQNLWVGHGFGREAWNQAYKSFEAQNFGWLGFNRGGPHNQFLDITFIGGIFSAIAYCIVCFLIVKILFTLICKSSPKIVGAALAALCSFVGLYLIRGLVESIRWEPLGIIFTWCLLLSYLHQRELSQK